MPLSAGYFKPNAASLGTSTLNGTDVVVALAAASAATDVLRFVVNGGYPHQPFYVKFGTADTVEATVADILIDPREGTQFISPPTATTHLSLLGWNSTQVNITEGTVENGD